MWSSKIPEQPTIPEMPLVKKPRNKTIQLNPNNENVGAVLISAVRYACGRRTYMPSIVVNVILPIVAQLNDKNLCCMERDIREAEKYSGGYGDEKIDKPMWLKFLKEIQDLMDKRGIERWW